MTKIETKFERGEAVFVWSNNKLQPRTIVEVNIDVKGDIPDISYGTKPSDSEYNTRTYVSEEHLMRRPEAMRSFWDVHTKKFMALFFNDQT